MARPTIPTIQAGQANWDALINDIVAALTERPLPLARVADLATLTSTFAASQYEDCVVLVMGPSKALYTSDGASWVAL